jgi:ERF superfamily
MISSPTVTKIAPALLEAQKSMGEVVKGSKNPFFKSSYADLNSVREAALPALNAQNISVFQPTCVINGENYVETVLLHESGEWISSLTSIVNVKGDAQSEGSGISYARRYGLQSLLNIGAIDDDGEAAMGRQYGKVNERSVATPTDNKSTGTTTGNKSSAETNENASAIKSSSAAADSKRPIKELIEKTFKKLELDGKVTKESFKKTYLGGLGLSKYAVADMPAVYEKIKKDFPYINGGT